MEAIIIEDVDSERRLIVPVRMPSYFYVIQKGGLRSGRIVTLIREEAFMTWFVCDAFYPDEQWYEHMSHITVLV